MSEQERIKQRNKEHKYDSLFKGMIASEKKRNPNVVLDECSVPKPNRDMSNKDQKDFYYETIHRDTDTMLRVPPSTDPEVARAIREECSESIEECYSCLKELKAMQQTPISSSEHSSGPSASNTSNDSQQLKQTGRVETPTEYVQGLMEKEPMDFIDPDG